MEKEVGVTRSARPRGGASQEEEDEKDEVLRGAAWSLSEEKTEWQLERREEETRENSSLHSQRSLQRREEVRGAALPPADQDKRRWEERGDERE